MSQEDKLEPHILKRFQCVKKIGSGAYGVVWKVMDKQTQKFYALKKNFDAFQNSTDAQRTFRQIMYLKKFQHPNIIQPKQVLRSMNEKDIYILFEYMDIDLYTLIKENILGERHKRYIIYQMAKALYYLHTAQLIHRDIKPSNVLVNQDCEAKMCDFGLVRSVYQQQEEIQPILTQYIATRWYRAPQILLGSKKYSKPSDVWSFGCMVGQMMAGNVMFPGNSTLNQIERVITWTGPPNSLDLQSLRTNFGNQMLDILKKVKPKNRKEWFTNLPDDGLDFIEKTLILNPQKRLNMLQILKHPFLKQFYCKEEIKKAKNPIIINVQDNQKLSLKEYRLLIYNLVQDYQQKNQIQSQLAQPTKTEITEQSKTMYKNRLIKNITRSVSKNKQESNPKINQKESSKAGNKKRYQTFSSKGKQETPTKKHVKTEEIQKQDLFPIRKKSQYVNNILKYYSNDKKKKSVSLYDEKKNSLLLAKYMYEHRKI